VCSIVSPTEFGIMHGSNYFEGKWRKVKIYKHAWLERI
jgi:hypothetical protein